MRLNKTSVDYDQFLVDLENKLIEKNEVFKSLFPGDTGALLTELISGILATYIYRIDSAELNSYMSTAFNPTSVRAIAQSMGASPRRKVGATCEATLTINSNLTSNVVIPKYTSFTTRGLSWHTRKNYTITPTTTSLDIFLYQGDWTTETFEANGLAFQKYLIGNDFNVDDSTMIIEIENVEWTRELDSLIQYGEGETRVFRESTTPTGQVRIQFGNGVYGDIPDSGITITASYSITEGASGNSNSIGDTVVLEDSISIGSGNFLEVSGITTSTSTGGDDEEEIEITKFLSPRIFSANKRAVIRNDYLAYILRYGGFADAKVWGEYEEALQLGYADNTMMCRAYISALKSDTAKVSDILGQTDSNTVYSGQLLTIPVSPGSVVIECDDETFYDLGEGLLASDTNNTNDITGVVSSSNSGDSTSISAFDDDSSTYYQSDSLPSSESPIRISFDFGASATKKLKCIRMKSPLITEETDRAFPSLISIWGSNETSPSDILDSDWELILANTKIQNIGVGEYTSWIGLDNNTNYRHYSIKILDSYGDSDVKISLIEGMDENNVSTIVYSTGIAEINFINAPAIDENIKATYLAPGVSQTEIDNLLEYIRKYNMFTNVLEFREPLAKPIDIVMDVYYLSTVDSLDNLRSEVDSTIQGLFSAGLGTINRDFRASDLYAAIDNLDGVDYAVLKSDELVATKRNEFVWLKSSTVNYYATDRS